MFDRWLVPRAWEEGAGVHHTCILLYQPHYSGGLVTGADGMHDIVEQLITLQTWRSLYRSTYVHRMHCFLSRARLHHWINSSRTARCK